MPAVKLTPLPPAPSRASPADFSNRADIFLGRLPTLATEINALVDYWNTSLDTSTFAQLTGASFTGAVNFNAAVNLRIGATPPAEGTTVAQFMVGGTGQNTIKLKASGILDFAKGIEIGGNAVYHTGNRPTAADVGALPSNGTANNSNSLGGVAANQYALVSQVNTKLNASEFTTGNVIALLVGAGGHGSGINSDLLDGVHGSDYARISVGNIFKSRQDIDHAATLKMRLMGSDTAWVQHLDSTATLRNQITFSSNPEQIRFVLGSKTILFSGSSIAVDGNHVVLANDLPYTKINQPNSLVFAQSDNSVSYGVVVDGSTLRSASIRPNGTIQASSGTLSGLWKSLGSTGPGNASLFVKMEN